jgi:hypothetical protein
MLVTLWCLAVVLGGLALVGVPLTWLLNGRRPLTEADHVAAPFLGAAAAVVVLQNLVYLDVPLRLSTPCFWAATAAAWLWFWRGGGLRAGLKTYPWALLAPLALVVAVQGGGLLLVGAREYLGRAWPDQYNYTCIAQFLMDVPFHTPWPALGDRPYLINAVALKDDRIGQSVLHGFFAVSSGLDAKALFEPSILLGPVLSALAVYALARRFGLGTRWAAAASLAAGLTPGLTAVHLECFFSHALGVPFLLFFPAAVDGLREGPGPRPLARAALLFAAGCSIYTEFWGLLLGVALLGLATAVWSHPRKVRFVLCHAALLLAPFALIPGASGSIWLIYNRRVSLPMLGELYPWAYSLEGLARIWLGDWAGRSGDRWQSFVRFYGLAVTGLGYLGLCQAWRDRLHQPAPSGAEPGRGSLSLATGVAAVALLPLVILVKDDQHPYQYYKLLMSVGPLLALGLALLWQRPPTAPSAAARPGGAAAGGRLRAAPGLLCFGAVAALAGAGAASMTLNSTLKHRKITRSSNAQVMRQPDVVAVGRLLQKSPGGDLILGFTDPYGGYLNTWFCYFGRRQQIRMLDPHFIYMHLWLDRGAHILDPNNLPADAPILLMKGPFQNEAVGDLEPVWSAGRFRLVKPTPGGSWALAYNLANPNGLEERLGQPFFWVGKEATTLQVSASRPGTLTLLANFCPGPCIPETQSPRLRVRTSAGHDAEFVTAGGVGELAVPVPAGVCTVSIESLDQPTQAVPGGDPRPLLVGVSNLEFRFTPETAPPSKRAAPEPTD